MTSSKAGSRISTKLTKVGLTSRTPSGLPTLGDYLSKDFFDKENFTYNIINIEEKNEAKIIAGQSNVNPRSNDGGKTT